MLRIITSKLERSVVKILITIVAVCISSAVFAVPPDEKLVVPGYNGIDADHLFTQLSEPKVKKGLDFTVGFLQVWGQSRPLTLIGKEVERKTLEYGGKFITYDAMGDGQKQVTQMNQLIAQKVDVIVAYQITHGTLAQGFKMAQKAGIKVVSIAVPGDSRTPLDPNVDAMVGMAFDLAGWETVKTLHDMYPNKKNVAFIGSAIPSDSLPIIENGMINTAKDLGYNILGRIDTKWDGPSMNAGAQALLTKYPDIEVILAFNEYAALAARQAGRAAGKNILVGSANGGDGAVYKPVKDGTLAVQYNTAFQETGEAAGIVAYKLLTGQKIPAKRILFKGVVATQDNVDFLKLVY